jgi:hypothetical protein
MSTIGTTLKQPRVFAHDAIALSGLCGNISGIIALPALTPTVSTLDVTSGEVAGTNYTVGGPYATTTNGGGSGATVNVLSLDVAAPNGVDTFSIATAGQDYEVGDILTVIDPTVPSDNNCQIIITEVGCSTWALGDPITQMPNEALGSMNSVPYWNEKMAYTYTSTLGGPHQTPGPGAAIYMGVGGDITVINESTTEVTYTGVAAGSFLPVSVLSVVALSGGPTTADVLALF